MKAMRENDAAARKMAFDAFDDSENDGDAKIAEIFKRTAKEWKAFLDEVTNKSWKVEAGEYTLSLTSPRGVAIDVMWDFNPMNEKVDITVEGPKKSKTFSNQSMSKLADGKKASAEYLSWLSDILGEAQNDILNAVLELSEGVGMMSCSFMSESSAILSEAKGGAYEKSQGQASDATYRKDSKNKVAGAPKNVAARSERRSKRKEIDARLRDEASMSNAMEFIDALLDEGIGSIPVSQLVERGDMSTNVERSLNNLIAVAQTLEATGNVIAAWATKAIASGKADLRDLAVLSNKRSLDRTTSDLGMAVARVLTLAVEESIDAGAERALNNLISVAQGVSARGREIAMWATKSIASGEADLRNLKALASDAELSKDMKSLGGAIARVVSLAAAMIGEAEKVAGESCEEGCECEKCSGGDDEDEEEDDDDDEDDEDDDLSEAYTLAWVSAATELLGKSNGKSQEDLHYRAYLRAIIDGNKDQATHVRSKFPGGKRAGQDLIDRVGLPE